AVYLEEHAMRHGLLTGPRAVARYFAGVAPAEPIREEALGMVEVDRPRLEVVSHSEARRIWGSEEEALPDIDEDELHDDLQLLSVPADAPPPEEPSPLDLPIEEDVHDLDSDLDDLLGDPDATGRQNPLS